MWRLPCRQAFVLRLFGFLALLFTFAQLYPRLAVQAWSGWRESVQAVQGSAQPNSDPNNQIQLFASNDNHWEAEIPGLIKAGRYQFFIHADDDQGLVARPVVVEVNNTSNNDAKVFLPLVAR
jgi:hypothetical protein